VPGARTAFNDPPAPDFSAVSVHDPSVFSSNDNEFYVIGSHLATAKTKDFIQWRQVTTDWNGRPNQFYPEDNPDPSVQKVQAQIDDVMRGRRNALGFYAGDIHLMPDGKFYHYYCITSSWYCSAIGLAIADRIEGPYITQGLIVRSGEASDNSLSPDGTARWSQAAHPNCIDPQVFFDRDNENFYMVYGSWSGGIFIYELDPATGMLKAGSALNAENSGYGRKLIRNNHVSIEGPYIIYSRETGYYYLFVSYGGLAANGGYNMRVFRSREPFGPYDDAAHPGEDMGTDLRFSEHFNYGVKIMGGYKFASLEGEMPQERTGYLSPGHNSVYRDSDTGRYFLIYHQRFEGRGEYHEVRVCELFLNEDGWFMAAPFRYDGGATRVFNRNSIPGTWKVINHWKANNTTPTRSVEYRFLNNGSITGPDGNAGTWELGSDGKTAHITINDILYKGVFLRSYDEDSRLWVQAFTALSDDGIALWGAGAVAGK
jgi:arabinan endo-1,5-alpha-L-arabinosidase